MKVEKVPFMAQFSVNTTFEITVFVMPFGWIVVDYTDCNFIYKKKNNWLKVAFSDNTQQAIRERLQQSKEERGLPLIIDGEIKYKGRNSGIWHNHLIESSTMGIIFPVLYAQEIVISTS